MKKTLLYQKTLAAVFALLIILSAIHPASHSDWWLEILPVFLSIPIIYFLGRKFAFSGFTYTLLAVYLVLPIAQAHYGVAKVPFGFTIGHFLGASRNMFDRLEHFSFGLFVAYPLFEIFRKDIRRQPFLNYFLPFTVIMGVSAVYEIVEWLVHEFATARLSFLFVAAQADFWDTAEDMAMALWGTLIALAIVFTVRQFQKRK